MVLPRASGARSAMARRWPSLMTSTRSAAGGVDAVADQGAEAGGADLALRQRAPQHRLGHRAAADIAGADDEDTIEHQSLKSRTSSMDSAVVPGSRIDGSSRLITRFQRASGAVVT